MGFRINTNILNRQFVGFGGTWKDRIVRRKWDCPSWDGIGLGDKYKTGMYAGKVFGQLGSKNMFTVR